MTGHEAFGHLAARYGLRQEGVAGLSPDAEPDAQRLGDLADLVKKLGVTVVFTEDLVSPRIADTLAREAGVKTETLNPLEGLTDRQLANGATYLTVMDQNLAKFAHRVGVHVGDGSGDFEPTKPRPASSSSRGFVMVVGVLARSGEQLRRSTQ